MKVIQNNYKARATIIRIACPKCNSILEMVEDDFEIYPADCACHYDYWEFKCPCCKQKAGFENDPFRVKKDIGPYGDGLGIGE